MKTRNLLLVILAFVWLARHAQANEHELVFGTNGLLGLGESTGGLITLNQGTVITAAATYNYAFSDYIQFGLSPALIYISGGTASGTVFQLLGGPTFNVPFSRGDLASAFFVSAMGGFITGGGSTTGAISGDLGVRARLVEHVSYRPSGGILFLTSGSSVLIVLRPISFAFLF